jgi:tRNA(Ile)-lysidine synthase
LKILEKLVETYPIRIILAHVNHRLRGQESDSDEKFVKALAKEKKHTIRIIKKDVAKLSAKLKKGLEEIGREIRYGFFRGLAKKYKTSLVIVAHHADDNLETIIMNFSRGASLKGLSGMKELEKLKDNLKLLRPILGISKKQVLDYLKTKKIKFRIDKSNKDTSYKRNFIRHKIIPHLQQLNPNITDTVAKNTIHLREISKMLETQAVNWIKTNSKDKSFGKFDAKTFRLQPKILQKEIILEIYKTLSGDTQNIETAHIEEVLKIINSNLGNKIKKLGKLSFSIKNNTISVSNKT